MKEIVADTHAFLWHFYSPKRVGEAARRAFALVEAGSARVWIPAAAIAEALMVAEKRRLAGLTPERLVSLFESFRGAENYRLCSLSPETVLTTRGMLVLPDIFDRLIVAEAVQRQLPLLTRDPVIKESQLVMTVWD